MGTNFYFKRRFGTEDINKIKSLVTKDNIINFGTEHSELSDTIYEITKEIHIGKGSGGWKFVFDHNDHKYWKESSVSSIKEWEKNNPNFAIVDEYGEEICSDSFWQMVDKWNSSSINYEYCHNDVLSKDGYYFCNCSNFS